MATGSVQHPAQGPALRKPRQTNGSGVVEPTIGPPALLKFRRKPTRIRTLLLSVADPAALVAACSAAAR
ncbi:hypothetical protein [Mycobacterium asiaticum]|uniref:hypothetical protein n=1 Tax=Mycobacterium asiaticum TaxID=1790 RepID=UPI0007EFBBE0|nr:hypothetical protein [Mycobacterium asiaticum]OBJ55408.1 hypothetical protein A9W94_19885 [Mycobacterium asiaticum]